MIDGSSMGLRLVAWGVCSVGRPGMVSAMLSYSWLPMPMCHIVHAYRLDIHSYSEVSVIFKSFNSGMPDSVVDASGVGVQIKWNIQSSAAA